MKVPLLNLKRLHDSIKSEINKAIENVYNDQNFIMGRQVKEFESNIAGYIGSRHAIGVASGTDALLLALKALANKIYGKESFNSGDEIITTPFTFVATGDTILLSGARPVFVDIDQSNYNIDPAKIRKYLSTNASKVVAVIPVHLYGQACEMDEIMKIAEEYDIYIIEDVAQALGGKWRDKKLGNIGMAGCLSFFPSKNLGCFGDGGMVVTNDDNISETVDILRKHGGKDKYNVNILGHNSRLDTLQASILLAKLKHLDRWNEGRRKVAEIYDRELSGIEGIQIPSSHQECYHVYHQYTIMVKERGELQANLKGKGVDTMVYYPFSLHKQALFKENAIMADDLKNAEYAASNVLSLPIDPLQSEEETNYVVTCIKESIG
jgi:dTDP-4-amino-4,6-dideoxygalactose transaminase